MNRPGNGPRSAARLLGGVVGLAVLGGVAGCGAFSNETPRTVSATFERTVGLYVESDVRVLGVKIGKVTAIEPAGDRVRVEMEYDEKYDVPADAKAVVVAPSIVSDRYVQLTPVYTGGEVLEDGAELSGDRTAVPVELDEIYASLDKLNLALGPKGANKDGSLTRFLDTAAGNLRGNGKNFNETVTKLSQLSKTLSGNKNDLFATIGNLAEFSTTLASSEQDVRLFQRQLADVSGFLADERENLAKTVRQLAATLNSVHKFIEDNRGRLKSNVDKLASVTTALVGQRAALAEILDVAPVALNNVINAYNATGGSLDARSNFNELTMSPLTLICYAVQRAPEGLKAVGDLCEGVAAPAGGAFPSPAEMIEQLQQGVVPELPLPKVDEFGRLQQAGGR